MQSAYAVVQTGRAERYLKALCNHFNRKVTAAYEGNHGSVQFGFGTCEMDASADALVIRVAADNAQDFARVKYVVADHLERFSANSDTLDVLWTDQT